MAVDRTTQGTSRISPTRRGPRPPAGSARSSRPRWPAPSSSGTSSSSTPRPRRWSSTSSSSRRATTRSTTSSRRSSPTRSASSLARSAASCSATSATSTAARSCCSSRSSSSASRRSSWAACRRSTRSATPRRSCSSCCASAQGFAVGGEWGGAVLLVAEHSPDKQRGFWASWPQAAVPVGNLLATVVLLTLSRTLTRGAVPRWGWRIGFWLSVVIVAVGYYIRTKVTDAPIFIEAQKEVEAAKKTDYGVIEVLQALPARRLHGHGPPLRARTSCTTSW